MPHTTSRSALAKAASGLLQLLHAKEFASVKAVPIKDQGAFSGSSGIPIRRMLHPACCSRCWTDLNNFRHEVSVASHQPCWLRRLRGRKSILLPSLLVQCQPLVAQESQTLNVMIFADSMSTCGLFSPNCRGWLDSVNPAKALGQGDLLSWLGCSCGQVLESLRRACSTV